MNAMVMSKGKKETKCCIDLGSSYFRKLSVDVIPDDVIPDGVIPDDVISDDVIPDDVFSDDVFPDGVLRVYPGMAGLCFSNPVQERAYIGWGDEIVANGSITRKTMDQAAGVLERLIGDAAERGDVRLTVVATNTLRVADNREEVRAFLEDRIGIQIDILSERGEAFLGFAGATSELPSGKPVILADPGGTSTELSWGVTPGASAFVSIPVGAHTTGVLYEGPRDLYEVIEDNFVTSGIPSGDSSLPGTKESPTIIFTGGTAVSLAVVWKQMNGEDCDDNISTVISMEELQKVVDQIDSLYGSGTEQSLLLTPERIRLLPQGTAIVRVLTQALRAKRIAITARDLRWGVVLGEGITERGYLADEQESPDSR